MSKLHARPMGDWQGEARYSTRNRDSNWMRSPHSSVVLNEDRPPREGASSPSLEQSSPTPWPAHTGSFGSLLVISSLYGPQLESGEGTR